MTRTDRIGPILRDSRTGIAILIVVLAVLFATTVHGFSSAFTIGPMLTQIAIFTVVGLAQMVVLSVGHMNLAVGGMGAVGALGAGLTFQTFAAPLLVGMLVGVLAGAVIGAINGVIIAYGGVNSFVVTLAMSFALLGLVPMIYAAVSKGSAISVSVPGLTELGRKPLSALCVGDTCGPDVVPILLIVTVLALLCVGGFFTLTRWGREVLLTGSSSEAATFSAIPVARRIVLVHVISGALAALAGIMLAASIGSFTPDIGQNFMLNSFLGPVLGGTLLGGGYISVIGTLLGVTLTMEIQSGLQLLSVGIQGLNVLLGLVLLAALSVDRVRQAFASRAQLRLTRRARTPGGSPGPLDPPTVEVTA